MIQFLSNASLCFADGDMAQDHSEYINQTFVDGHKQKIGQSRNNNDRKDRTKTKRNYNYWNIYQEYSKYTVLLYFIKFYKFF